MGLFIWDSQPSKIFVWDTSISKVFLWDTQVRPVSKSISVDFRNLSALPTGWSVCTDDASYSFSGGFKANSNHNTTLFCPLDMTKLKTLSIAVTWARTSASRPWSDSLWITQAKTWLLSYPTWSEVHFKRSFGSNSTQSDGNFFEANADGGTYTTFATWSENLRGHRTYNYKLEIDFQTWLVRISGTEPSSLDRSGTMTSSQIEAIKSDCAYVFMRLWPRNSTTNTLYTMQIDYTW